MSVLFKSVGVGLYYALPITPPRVLLPLAAIRPSKTVIDIY